MATLTLVLGGVRSGKSRFAEQLAVPPSTYLATALAGDDEMAHRIAAHRDRRAAQPSPWRTIEEPWNVPAVVAAHQVDGALLLECLPLWLTNLMLGLPGRTALADDAVRAEVTTLLDAVRGARGRVIVVSNEVGCGGVSINALARRFADLLGESNQRLAADADEVFCCVAGIPVRIKCTASGQG